MAEKRMFAKQIIDSDAFLDMSLSTQALYFHLCMRADDDGFINNPKRIQRLIGSGDDELKLLIAKRFVIPFESGVCVIKHWKIHNYIQKDRYKPTVYENERLQLETKENKAYRRLDTNCIQSVSELCTSCTPRLDKNRLDKNRLDKNNKEQNLLLSLFEELGFGTINSITATDIDLLEKEYSAEWVKEAFKEANNANIRNLKYVNGILKNWKTKGFKAEKIKHNNNYNAKGFKNFKPRTYDYDDLEKKLLGWDKDE